MADDLPCQRWSFPDAEHPAGGRPSWRRPEDGGFDKTRYGFKEIDEQPARDFVTAVHYEKAWLATKARYGMFDLAGPEPRLVGAAILSVPTNNAVLTKVWPHLVPNKETIDLGRFCLLDAVPANAETDFLAEVGRLAAKLGFRGLVMFSDPGERWTPDGRLIKPGHHGIMYQAWNAGYTGQTDGGPEWHLPDGTVINRRTAQKIRAQEAGHEYAEKLLIRNGARVMRAGEQPAAWLREALPDARAIRVIQEGKHRYVKALGTNRAERRAAAREMVLPTMAYPKPYLGQLELFNPHAASPGAAAPTALAGSPQRSIMLTAREAPTGYARHVGLAHHGSPHALAAESFRDGPAAGLSPDSRAAASSGQSAHSTARRPPDQSPRATRGLGWR